MSDTAHTHTHTHTHIDNVQIFVSLRLWTSLCETIKHIIYVIPVTVKELTRPVTCSGYSLTHHLISMIRPNQCCVWTFSTVSFSNRNWLFLITNHLLVHICQNGWNWFGHEVHVIRASKHFCPWKAGIMSAFIPNAYFLKITRNNLDP